MLVSLNRNLLDQPEMAKCANSLDFSRKPKLPFLQSNYWLFMNFNCQIKTFQLAVGFSVMYCLVILALKIGKASISSKKPDCNFLKAQRVILRNYQPDFVPSVFQKKLPTVK